MVNGRSTERSRSGLMKPDHSRSVSQPAETRSNSIVMKRLCSSRPWVKAHTPTAVSQCSAANKAQSQGLTFRSNGSFFILFDRNKASRAAWRGVGGRYTVGLLETQKDRKDSILLPSVTSHPATFPKRK